MILRSIAGQLSAALLVIISIAGMLILAGTFIVRQAERDFRDLAENHIPRVALAGELAEFSGDLAALAVRIVAHPEKVGEHLRNQVETAAAGIESLLAISSFRDAAERQVLIQADAQVRVALDAFIDVADQMALLERKSQAVDQDLRWIHVDVQDQVGALLQDLSFDMDAQLSVLVDDADPDLRKEAKQSLMRDQQMRNRLQRIATEAATLATLLLHARSTNTADALDAAERLGHDTLDSIALTQQQLPNRQDVRLVLEDVERLVTLVQGDDGVFGLTRRQIVLRQSGVSHLSDAQEGLSMMQSQLSTLAQAERLAAQDSADHAAQSVLRGSFWLSTLAIAGALTAACVFFLFVRNRILRRIQDLSLDLRRIAGGDVSIEPSMVNGDDEISDMARAVEVFRKSAHDLQLVHHELSNEVDERRLAVKRLELTQRELVQAGKMAALGQMSAAISHEINQPLAAMRHRLHVLKKSFPEAVQQLERTEALVDRVKGIIVHLRRIARRSDFRRVKINLLDPVTQVLGLLGHQLQIENIRVKGLDELEGIEVEGDDILLEQVLLNVVGNSIDAIAETGRGEGSILIFVEEQASLVTLQIIDNGIGLGGHAPGELIDPFFTTKDIGRGLGLGLSIAYNVMQDMGGFLEIAPANDCGAEVRLRLRRWGDAEEHVPSGHDEGPLHV